MSLSPYGSCERGSTQKKNKPSNVWDTPPPGSPPARQTEEESEGSYERGRAYWRPTPDLGQGKGSVKVGPFEFKVGGKGVSGALAVGFLGSVAMVGISAHFALPTAAIVVFGLAPMLVVSVLILVLLLSQKG